jgi:hypothetical protein
MSSKLKSGESILQIILISCNLASKIDNLMKTIAKLAILEAKLQEIRIIWMNTIILSNLTLQIPLFS